MVTEVIGVIKADALGDVFADPWITQGLGQRVGPHKASGLSLRRLR